MQKDLPVHPFKGHSSGLNKEAHACRHLVSGHCRIVVRQLSKNYRCATPNFNSNWLFLDSFEIGEMISALGDKLK